MFKRFYRKISQNEYEMKRLLALYNFTELLIPTMRIVSAKKENCLKDMLYLLYQGTKIVN